MIIVSLFLTSHVNPFTGIIYQSVLLTHQPAVRSVSMEETVLPNTSPAQWPGNIRRLSERTRAHIRLFYYPRMNIP